MRVDGENLAAAPIERILLRLPELNQVAVYAVPDPQVGDQVMAAVVLNDGAELTPLSSRPSSPHNRICPPRRGPGSSASTTHCRRRPPTRSSSAN
jgi:acyl-CoA synthetase (AMP-forming)/AMP-acid ligase II